MRVTGATFGTHGPEQDLVSDEPVTPEVDVDALEVRLKVNFDFDKDVMHFNDSEITAASNASSDIEEMLA